MRAEDIRQVEETGVKAEGGVAAASRQQPGFMDRVLSFLAGTNNRENERRRLVRDVTRMLKSTRYKFYKSRSEEALPPMAKFFYELYTIVGPAQLLLDHAESSGVLKSIIIERSFTPEQTEMRSFLTEENITSRSKQVETTVLSEEVKERLTNLLSGFDSNKVKEINAVYNLLCIFLDAIHFDYYFLLKKFDANMPERDFRFQPHFETIQAEYVLEDLKDFLSMVYLLDPKANWEFLLEVLKEYRNVDIVRPNDWAKFLRSVFDVRRSRVLELIVQHASKDPKFRVKVVSPSEKIVEDYLSKLKSQSEIVVQKLIRDQRTQKIDLLAKAVFGTASVARTKNYTEKYNSLFTPRMLGGFTHVAQLNFLKAFIIDFFKQDFREIVDLLIVRGRWSTPLMSQQLSESFHVLLEISDELLQFDDSLADEAELGIRLKGLLWKAEREKLALKALRQLLKETNESALSMVQRSAQNLVVMAKSFRIVIEDYDKKGHELITNWKEIESASKGDIRAKIVDAYKKIYYFIQLMQMYAKKEAA